jgi:hypothetical protein
MIRDVLRGKAKIEKLVTDKDQQQAANSILEDIRKAG